MQSAGDLVSFGSGASMSAFFDPVSKTNSSKTGKHMSVPVNPNIPLLYYRADLYQQKGLKVPTTWDELLANAKALHNPPQMYGIGPTAIELEITTMPISESVPCHASAAPADCAGSARHLAQRPHSRAAMRSCAAAC